MSVGHVVLVGAGHANLALVRRARRLRRAGLAVTLVDPGAFWYSGLAAAVLGGAVSPHRDRIDPAPATARRGVRFLVGRAVGVEPGDGLVHLDGGRSLRATAVILNVGSDVDPHDLPTDRPEVVTAKPIRNLVALHERLLGGPVGPRVVVVGGGATALEVAGNLSAGPVADAVRPRVIVVAGDRPLEQVSDPRVRARMLAPLRARGVVWDEGPLATDITDAGVVLDDGRVLPADHVVLATGLRASRTVEQLGLGDADGMPTTATLQHPEHPRLLGAGDAIRFGEDGLPRLGVFAVRQVPVLMDNLLALHRGEPLRPFEPPETYLTAVDLGGGDAVVMRGRLWFAGWPALVVKRILDEWFLRRHRIPAWSLGAPRTVGRRGARWRHRPGPEERP